MTTKTKTLIIILIIIIIIIILLNKYNFFKKDNFFVISNPKDIFDNDGKMKFDYLNDPYYTENVLKKYYINDDKKLNGVKVNSHIYANSYPNCENARDTVPYVYSGDISFHCRRKNGWWNKYDTLSQDIYNLYGVRR